LVDVAGNRSLSSENSILHIRPAGRELDAYSNGDVLASLGGWPDEPHSTYYAYVSHAARMSGKFRRALPVSLGKQYRDADAEAESGSNLVCGGYIEHVNPVVDFGTTFGSLLLLVSSDEVAV
jgi:hypothetical protein